MRPVKILSIVFCVLLGSLSQAATPPDLFKHLSNKREPIRLRAIAMLRADPTAIGANLDVLCRAISQHEAKPPADPSLVPSSTLHLIDLVGSVNQTQATDELVRLLESPRKEIVMAAADAIGRYSFHDGALPTLIEQVQRPEFKASYGFRVSVLRAVSKISSPAAVEVLTEQAQVLTGQLGFEINEYLDTLTVADFGGDEAKFEAWKQVRAGPRKPRLQLFDHDPYRRIKLAPAQFYGLDIHADRMLFIIDRSGSMAEKYKGASRLRHVVAELSRTLEALPETSMFSIISYSDKAKVWQQQLVPATADHKRSAIGFLARMYSVGLTNTHEALTTALFMNEDVEAIYLLSDGAPTTGRIVAPAMILEDITFRNTFRNITINTIGITVTGRARAFMEQLAEQNGGQYKLVDTQR